MSGGLVPYHLRPNKAVDRHLFVELLSKINRFLPIESYTYVGFGGPFLEDFKLIHSHFGNKTMLSIENDFNVWKRQRFNLPLSCIQCFQRTSGDFISSYPVQGNAIVWLDYTKPREIRVQFQEFEALLTKMQTYDVVKITLNANPESLREHGCFNKEGKRETAEERNIKRHQKLSGRLGEYLPQDTTPEMMSIDDFPKVLYRVAEFTANKALRGRNEEIFQPLTAFIYADSSHQMLTIAGIILPKNKIREFFNVTAIKKWRLSATNWEKIRKIRMPELTPRERLFIDRQLPKASKKRIQKKLNFLFDEDEEKSLEIIESYLTYYRHYPSYHRVVF